MVAQGAAGVFVVGQHRAHHVPEGRAVVHLAQVRQFSVSRGEDGQVTSLPHLERTIANCLEGIRRARSARGVAGSRLDMNHVWLHIWPPVSADLDQLTKADPLRGVKRRAVVTFVEDLDAPPVDAHDVYLRLHLLSHRLVRPNGQNLEGIFGLLATSPTAATSAP